MKSEDFELVIRKKILDWLAGNSNTTYEELQSVTVENSGDWFLNKKEFITWTKGIRPHCLWCFGTCWPFFILLINICAGGVGKSILM